MENRILVAREKHGTRYMKAATNEELATSCLKLLKERVKWYKPGEPPNADKICTAEQIANLPVHLRQEEIRKRTRFDRDMRMYEEDVAFYEIVKKVIEENDISEDLTKIAKLPFRMYRGQNLPIAYLLLTVRTDGEYENVNLKELE